MLCRIIEDNISKRWFFFFCSQTPTNWAFPNLLQMPNNYRTVGIEFFSNFSCNCMRIGFDDPLNWTLSTSRYSKVQGSQAWWSPWGCKRVRHNWATDGQPLCSSSSRLLSPLQDFLNCAYMRRSWVKCIVDAELSLLIYDPFWTRTRKSLKFAFCLTSFP